jgi:GT2 family glycosyltransferase
MRVLYIAVNYGTSAHAQRFVECVARSPQDARLIMVDNTEAERRQPLIFEPALNGVVHYCPTHGNLGYFGGARYGASTPMARDFDADWVAVSNVDLTFDAARLRAILAQHDTREVGIVAPAITSRFSLENLNPFMGARPTRTRMHAYKYIFRWYAGFVCYEWLSRVVRRRSWWGGGRDGDSAERAIYAPHGSFMIFSREFFRRGGSLDHSPFLFCEEITIGERARSMSLPVLYCPTIRMTHEQHASVSKLPGRAHHRLVSVAVSHVTDAYFR